jgi:hypothetical protein
VAERAAPEGHPDRDLAHIGKSLLEQIPKALASFNCMPVGEPALESSASNHARVRRGRAVVIVDLHARRPSEHDVEASRGVPDRITESP